ncbi:MAG: branched-chain amino acid ABC transporter permease [Christensenellales bacterium]|jgi:branched-chain amino acid transport system permease protein
MTKSMRKSYLINFVAVAALFVVLMGLRAVGIIDNYYDGILVLVCINIMLAVSLNLATGCLGQIALGHAGFMSIGAYTAALVTKWLAMPVGMEYFGFLIGLLLGGLVAAVFGLAIGLPALRLKGDYLAIITLGFGEIIRVVIENLSFTGGAQGLRGIPRLSTLPVAFIICVISVFLLTTLMRSRHGRAILAIREDDIASGASGIHNTYYKTLAFTVAAFFAGVAGGLYAHYISVLGAKSFNFMRSIEILIIVVLGGLGSFTGSIVSAVLLTILPEQLREFADYRMLIYSVALIALMMFKPTGLFGIYEFSLTRAREYWKQVVKGERKLFRRKGTKSDREEGEG